MLVLNKGVSSCKPFRRFSHSVVTAPDVKIICTDRELDEKDVRLVTTYTMQLKKFAVTIHLPVAFV